MSEEREIWNSAQNMIDRYGHDALSQINKRISELRDTGEAEALDFWMRIRTAAQTLLDDKDPRSRH